MKKRQRGDDLLTPDALLDAYSVGIFPMGDEDTDEIFWFRPDPRAIIPLGEFHISRRLRRTMRQERFEITYNRAFSEVMAGCAARSPVWITPRIHRAYTRLFEVGRAHSVEVWQQKTLAGGLYGVQLGGAFVAESKFHRVTDASKVALAKLVERLLGRGFRILEVQYLTDHLKRLGAREIPLYEYLRDLRDVANLDCRFD